MNLSAAYMFLNVSKTGGVAHVQLSNPPVNSFSLGLRQELLAVLAAVEADETVQAVVLSGANKAFSAGGDLKEFGTPHVLTHPRLTLHLHPRIEHFPKPIVAALHGYALGGGFETAMACHGRVACEDTLIALPEVGLGVIPMSGTQRLPHFIGMAAAAAMILSGTRRKAAEMAPGLFDRLVAAGDTGALLSAATDLARQLAANGAPFPSARLKPIDTKAANACLGALRAETGNGDAVRRGALEALQGAVDASDFDAGMAIANRITEDLLGSLPRK
jgi:enoyl-CoA hydratase